MKKIIFILVGIVMFAACNNKKNNVNENQKPQEKEIMPEKYISKDVFFKNNIDSFKLAGTVTYPKNGENFPAVVLVSGSGLQNRNEEIMGHKPFLIIADYLSRHGIAVLRYDDRSFGQSRGSAKNATTMDFCNDAEAAINYLKTLPNINKNNIGIIGHSEGGIIAPMIASKRNDIKFIVTLAGPGERCDSLMLRQQAAILPSMGLNPEQVKNTIKINAHLFEIIRSSKNDELHTKMKKYFAETVKKIPKEEKVNMSDSAIIESELKKVNTYLIYFIRINPSEYWEKVKCAVLSLNGSKDTQVSAKENLQEIKKSLQKAGNKNFETLEINGLNHLFQKCKTGLPDEYAKIDQTISSKVLDKICSWILEQTKM